MQTIKLLKEILSKTSLTFFSDKSAKDICEEIKSILSNSNAVFSSPNLSGQINTENIFKITHKVESLVIKVGGFGGMSANLTGQIFEHGSGSKIIVTIKPNSYFALAFIAFFVGGLFIMFLTIFSLTDDNDSLLTGLFALLIASPILLLISYNAKKSLVDTFVTTFKLTKTIPDNE